MPLQALVRKSAGLDVHRKSVTVAIATKVGEGEDDISFEVKEYPTFRKDLRRMAAELKRAGVELAVMEGTGVYWKSVYESLEDENQPAIVVNAYHVKNVPGRKTDVADSKWLAQLAMFGLLRASFIPTRDLRDLRMITRYRTRLSGTLAAQKNRLHKTLDASGIRLGAVVSDIDGVSARDMIDGLIEGKLEPNDLAKKARGRLRKKSDEIIMSLDGRLGDRHRFLLQEIRDHVRQISDAIKRIDMQVVAAMEPYRKE